MFQPVKAVSKAVRKGGSYQLPATASLFTESPLDVEEKTAKSEVGFLFPNHQEKPQKSTTQGNWKALDASLSGETATALKSPPMSASARRAAESDWHEIPEARMTPQLQNDLRVIENRQHLDPKRFYKSSGSGRKKGQLPSKVHVGTVVVGAHEFYSSRLTRKERRRTMLDEVMSDGRIVNYTKNKFKSIQKARQGNTRVVDPAAKKRKKGRWQ